MNNQQSLNAKVLGIDVKIENDGKEKRQSFEAIIEKAFHTPNGYIEFYAHSYGASESEAVKNLNDLVLLMPNPNQQKVLYADEGSCLIACDQYPNCVCPKMKGNNE